MKVTTTTLAIAMAAIGISSVMAKAVPQEAIELPASLLTDRTISRLRPCWDTPDDSIHCTTKLKREIEHLRPCWDGPDDSIHCPHVKREAEAEGGVLGPCWRQPDDTIRCPVSRRDAEGGYCFVDFEGVERCVNKNKNELGAFSPEDEAALLAFGCYYADCGDCPLERHDCKTGAVIPIDTGSYPPEPLSLDNGNGNGNGNNVLATLAKRGDCFSIYGGIVCPKLKRVADGKSHNTCSSPPLHFPPPSSSSSGSGHGAAKEGVLLAQSSSPFHVRGRRMKRLGRRQVEANFTATALGPAGVDSGLTLPGTFSPCGEWYLVTEADHVAGCAGIEARRGVGLEILRQLNTDIDPGCTNLRLGYWYCLAGQFLLLSRENAKLRIREREGERERERDIKETDECMDSCGGYIEQFYDIQHFYDLEQQRPHRGEYFATAERLADILGRPDIQQHQPHRSEHLATPQRIRDILGRSASQPILLGRPDIQPLGGAFEQHDTTDVSYGRKESLRSGSGRA